MNKRKILLLAALLVMVAILGVGGTLAYFTAEDSATNEFTVGNVKIDLIEPKWDEIGKHEAKDAYPGEALAKNPQVVNTGNNPCFVRIKVTGLDQFVQTYGEDAMIGLRYIDADGVYHEGINETDWEYHEGYYYYKKVLATVATAGDAWNVGLVAKTPELFSQIVIPTQLQNGEATNPVEIKAYAVQAQGARPSWSDVKVMSVADIAAWFDTCAPDTW